MGLKVYTGGTFDLPHAGHVNFLSNCARLAGHAGTVTVSLNTDEFIHEFKNAPPIMTYEERAAVLRAITHVTYVIPNTGGADSRPAIEQANPDLVVIGSDWAVRDYHAQMGFTQDWLDERGIGLCYLPYTRDISSTEVKKRVLDRYCRSDDA